MESGGADHARVWVVDDSPLEAEMARKALATSFEVEVFHDAATMLERLSSNDRPDVLVVDWHMPNVSGLDVCAYVRTSTNGAELPILVLTATGDEDDLLIGLAAGANDFVTKPYRVAELTARVSGLATASRLHRKLGAAETGLREDAAFRERFMAILAHDLRQPLNVFAMGAGLLSGVGPADGPLRAVSTRFGSAASRMNRMLDELLDFTRARHENGMPVQRHPSDLREVAQRVVDEVRQSHPTRQVLLEASGDCAGQWDADRIAQVFSNLVSNALQHSDASCPVRVSVHGRAEDVEIAVENECPPIAETILATIFEPFRQGAASRTGLGLGLYIVRAIARAHGGDVAVESNNTRTRFVAQFLRLPAAPPTPRRP